MKAGVIIQQIEEIAPKSLACFEGDNNGLLVGDYSREITKTLLALDLTEDIVDEAISLGCQMIVTHHPIIFKGIKNIRQDTTIGKILTKAIKADLNIYTAHTNLDVAKYGVNYALCKKLDFDLVCSVNILQKTFHDKLFKLAVYVPEENAEEVMEAISNAGAGNIGKYSHCTFQSQGKGTFKPLEGSNPFIGNLGKIEVVDEIKLETIIEQSNLKGVLRSMLKAHPYEEVAYDIIPLANETQELGLGKIIELENTMDTESLAKHVLEKLGCDALKLFGESNKIRKIAICGGSGSSVISPAKFSGCQVLITGDVDYHKGQMAVDMGLTVIDAGHYYTEVPVLEHLRNILVEKNSEVEFLVTKINTCPYKIVTL